MKNDKVSAWLLDRNICLTLTSDPIMSKRYHSVDSVIMEVWEATGKDTVGNNYNIEWLCRKSETEIAPWSTRNGKATLIG